MSLLHLFILAFIQGITEFLPVSSSGHLAILPLFMEWKDQGLLIDVAVHIGTLLAVMIYFRRDVVNIIMGFFATLGFNQKVHYENGRMFRYLLIASLPVFAAGGLLVATGHSDIFRNPTVIAVSSIVFGFVLYAADQRGLRDKNISDLSNRSALLIGLAQALALIPGTSRSGITMTAGRMLGFERTEAAKFSMLLSIPTIMAAGAWSTFDLLKYGSEGEIIGAAFAAAVSFLTAIAAIHFLMKWLTHASMTIFVVYRVLLGVVILVWLYA